MDSDPGGLLGGRNISCFPAYCRSVGITNVFGRNTSKSPLSTYVRNQNNLNKKTKTLFIYENFWERQRERVTNPKTYHSFNSNNGRGKKWLIKVKYYDSSSAKRESVPPLYAGVLSYPHRSIWAHCPPAPQFTFGHSCPPTARHDCRWTAWGWSPRDGQRPPPWHASRCCRQAWSSPLSPSEKYRYFIVQNTSSLTSVAAAEMWLGNKLVGHRYPEVGRRKRFRVFASSQIRRQQWAKTQKWLKIREQRPANILCYRQPLPYLPPPPQKKNLLQPSARGRERTQRGRGREKNPKIKYRRDGRWRETRNARNFKREKGMKTLHDNYVDNGTPNWLNQFLNGFCFWIFS